MRMLIAVLVLAAAADTPPVQTVKGGILDEVTLYTAKLPETKTAMMRPFSAGDEDITQGEKKDETRKMQPIAPGLLADQFVSKLKPMGPFTEVAVLNGDTPAEAIIVEGKFKEMDPGSRAKRYLVGYGAGKSGVSVEGTVKSADGTLLAAFKQRRVGVMGVAGGDSMDKLREDTKAIGADIAKFLSTWANGKKLK
jgi:hypothetical protein